MSDLNMKLSPNFSLSELTKSDTALRHGIDNTPDEEAINNLTILANEVLQKVREQFGPTKVNSGFRHPNVNAAVGGSTTSDHCKGMAADIEVPGVPNADLAKWIVDNCDFRQVILEFYTPGIPDSGWVHVAYNIDDNKKQVLTAMKENGKTVYKAGLIP